MGTGEAGEGRDLTRYAVRVVGTDEILDVGLKRREADSYVGRFNLSSLHEKVESVQIEWTINEPARQSL